jgi:hypothetical protein
MSIRESFIKLSVGKDLEILPVNGKCLYIDTSSVTFLVQKDKDDNDVVNSVTIENEFKITLGDKFSIPLGALDSVYEVEFIAIEKNRNSIVMFSAVPTRTTTFLLPLLGKTKAQLRYPTYFVNSFIDDNSQHISLLYRFTGTVAYKLFEQEMMSDPLCVAHRDYDSYHVMYVFEIPRKFIDDINHFKAGKYSLFSKALRQRILKFYGGEDEAATLQIIRQDKSLRKQLEQYLKVKIPEDSELASKPDLKIEIYNPQL